MGVFIRLKKNRNGFSINVLCKRAVYRYNRCAVWTPAGLIFFWRPWTPFRLLFLKNFYIHIFIQTFTDLISIECSRLRTFACLTQPPGIYIQSPTNIHLSNLSENPPNILEKCAKFQLL